MSILWRYDESGKGPANIPTPVVRDGYVSTAASRVGGALIRLKPAGDGIAVEPVYYTRGLPNSVGGSVLLGDTLYGTNSEGLIAAGFVSGKIKWQNPGVGGGSITYADGNLYIHGENGDVALVEATAEGYREKGRFTPPNQPKHSNQMEKAWAYPVVANGRLYIRDLGSLWCYDIRK